MGRNRVLSFMSQFSAGSKTPTPSSSPPDGSPTSHPKSTANSNPLSTEPFPVHQPSFNRPSTPPSRPDYGSPVNQSPVNSPRQRANSRPTSMVNAHQPPLMEMNNDDTIPELQPVFSFLNSHSNKLYQEGYFLKLDDQNTQGRPNPDRTWTECFAQLVGTVLSLWDAAELDAAGEDGEVLPKFINLTDASIKMIESLPTRSSEEQPLQNILSISTAGRNRYLLHFNSHHSLIQWTAGIRLAMFEHSTLQEAYTGALVAGKGKTLNNINVVMERSRLKTEDWVRVRFGAGVPWRRCWCVISPPDEKEYIKLQKDMKKRSAYDRSAVPQLKGDIKFYDTRKDGKKQKKMQPIATITDAYSAYAIYPQAKALVDASTLIKIEGNVAVHSDPPSATEGFVFIMPEVPPAVSGFEMLLRFLFPTWDTFCLYGRPGRLVASVLDPKSLMFAMPKHKRYGYLEILDVSGLITQQLNSTWTEKQWRKQLKEVTGTRMNAVEDGTASHSRNGSRTSNRLSFGGSRPRVGFAEEGASTRSSRSHSLTGPPRTDSAPPDTQRERYQPAAPAVQAHHVRTSSDPNIVAGAGNPNSPHRNQLPYRGGPQDNMASNNSMGQSDERGYTPTPPVRELDNMRTMHTPEPVSRPPAFNHDHQARSNSKAHHSPELRRANSRLSSTTLAQIAKANGVAIPGGPAADEYSSRREGGDGMVSGPSVHPHANSMGTSANDNRSREALSTQNQNRPPGGPPAPLHLSNQRPGSPYGPPSPRMQVPNSPGRPPGPDGRRSPYPPGSNQRPAHPQNPNYQNRPADGGPGGPPNQGRGMPGPRPPLHNTPPHQDQNGNYRPGTGSRPYPGPGGPPPGGNPNRKPLPNAMPGAPKHTSVTTNDIIDHYTSDQNQPYQQRPPPNTERRPPPPPHGGSGYSGQNMPYGDGAESGAPMERPRAGVMKTVGGGERPMQPRSQFDIPNVNFGPTLNYGAGQVPRKQVGDPAQEQRPYSPAGQRPGMGEQRPSFTNQRPPNAPPSHGRQESGERAKNTMAWQPGGSSAGSGAHGLSPEQYVQQRAAAASPQYGHGRDRSGGGTSPQSMDPRSMPPQGQYSSRPGTAQSQRSGQPQYQGQAF